MYRRAFVSLDYWSARRTGGRAGGKGTVRGEVGTGGKLKRMQIKQKKAQVASKHVVRWGNYTT